MANTLITPSTIAPAALASLYETTQMLPLVYTDVSSSFTGQKVGNTVNVKKPAVFTAQTFNRGTGIVPQDATETTVPVVLDTLKDVSFVVTSEDLTLSVTDFQEQFLDPAMEALSQSVDQALIARAKADFTTIVGAGTNITGAVPGEVTKTNRWQMPEVLIDAGKELNIRKVPPTDRAAVIGPTTNAWWLDSTLLKHADKSGSNEALRLASVGKNLYGFDTFWSQNIVQPAGSPATGQPTTEVDLAFHKTALAFASATLEVAPGSNASVMSYKGLSIRVAYDYDIKYKQTVVSLDTLFGTKTLDANRGVLIRGPLQP